MSFPQMAKKIGPSYEENAIFARLVALNAAFEAARVGKAARGLAHRALSSDALLEAFLEDLRAQRTAE